MIFKKILVKHYFQLIKNDKVFEEYNEKDVINWLIGKKSV